MGREWSLLCLALPYFILCDFVRVTQTTSSAGDIEPQMAYLVNAFFIFICFCDDREGLSD
jgi:hypothetical protein